MVDYRDYANVDEYRRACAAQGTDLSIFLCATLSAMMRRRGMTFPEALEEAIRLGVMIPADPELVALLRTRGLGVGRDRPSS